MEFINENKKDYTFEFAGDIKQTVYNCVSIKEAILKAEDEGIDFCDDFKVSSKPSVLYAKSKPGLAKRCIYDNFKNVINIDE